MGVGRLRLRKQRLDPCDDSFPHVLLDVLARQSEASANRSIGIFRVHRPQQSGNRNHPLKHVKVRDFAWGIGAKAGEIRELAARLGRQMRLERDPAHSLPQRTAPRTMLVRLIGFPHKRFVHTFILPAMLLKRAPSIIRHGETRQTPHQLLDGSFRNAGVAEAQLAEPDVVFEFLESNIRNSGMIEAE